MTKEQYIKQETERLIDEMIKELKKSNTDLTKLAKDLNTSNLLLESEIAESWGESNEDINLFD